MNDEAIMNGLATYIFGAILGTTQLALVAYQWYSRRDKTKAEATQITANSFDTLTKTITTMATDFSGTLMKTIELVNLREKRIGELEDENRQRGSDLKELRGQLNDSVNANVQRDTKLELQQKSIESLATANSSQAKELIEVKAQMYTLQKEIKNKEEALLEKDKQILRQDERIKALESRVEHLEKENAELKKPVPIVEEKASENPT